MTKRSSPRQSLTHLAFGSAMLAIESQQVIALRLTKMAFGGANAAREVDLMVSEKVQAMTQSSEVLINAVLAGTADGGAGKILSLYRKKVRANRKRLTS